MPTNSHYDVIIIGAGGAGMMCAQTAARRERRVLIMDHASKVGAKILISGGGRCNFTNIDAGPANYVSTNPHFCKSALSRFTPADFIALVEKHLIPYHEKKLGQLFCDHSAQNIIDMLITECRDAGASFLMESKITKVQKTETGFEVQSTHGTVTCESLVIATGGMSIPKIGATGFGYKIAEQFGLKIIPISPALDGFTFDEALLQKTQNLSGVSVDCILTSHGTSFRENILFTHKGLSGPAALQGSLYWKKGDTIQINLLPDCDPEEWLIQKKRDGSGAELRTILKEKLPDRVSEFLVNAYWGGPARIAQSADKEIQTLAAHISCWEVQPSGTVGYSKAEVTRGGVNTHELSSKTMESQKVPGLYFIGEVLDVTGWLGGYNFQWAWSSGVAAGLSA